MYCWCCSLHWLALFNDFNTTFTTGIYLQIFQEKNIHQHFFQGLTDSSEFVAAKSINAMASLTELGLLHKPAITELVGDTACLLVHPNLWIRQAVVGFISVVAKTLKVIDVHCKVIPTLTPYMKYSLLQIDV